jgi:hypothetical protein
MKTQTQNSNTRNQNFFQKSFILLAILAFTSFGFKAKAQQQFHTDVQFFGSTSSGCDWVIKGYSGSGLPKFTGNISSPTPYQICQSWSSGLLDRITISDGTCVLTFTASGGVFPLTTYTSPCSGTTCAISISGSGSQSGSGCAADGFIIIQIYY